MFWPWSWLNKETRNLAIELLLIALHWGTEEGGTTIFILILNWSRSSKTSDGRGGATGLHWAIGCLAGTRRKEIENEEGNGQNKRT